MIFSIPWVIPCNIIIHGTLSLDQSSRNFCLNFLTTRENKDTLLYQNTKLNFAVNGILSDFLLLIASYLAYCKRLKKEGTEAQIQPEFVAQISARHNVLTSVFALARSSLVCEMPRSTGTVLASPSTDARTTLHPQLPWPHWHSSIARACVKPLLYSNLAKRWRTALQPRETEWNFKECERANSKNWCMLYRLVFQWKGQGRMKLGCGVLACRWTDALVSPRWEIMKLNRIFMIFVVFLESLWVSSLGRNLSFWLQKNMFSSCGCRQRIKTVSVLNAKPRQMENVPPTTSKTTP